MEKLDYNILAIVGSNNPKSYTYKITKELLERIKKEKFNFSIEIIFLHDYDIKYCHGCMNCFNRGFCPLDQEDEFNIIKEKLHRSDIIIFSTPVYAHALPGIMKSFIDRISSSLHLLEYAGKLGFTVTTTEGNGQEVVSKYIRGLQSGLGIKNLDNFIFARLKNEFKSFIESSSSDFIKRVEDNYGYSNDLLEDSFIFFKKMFTGVHEDIELYQSLKNKYECNYWNQRWIQECDSFQEFARKNRKINVK
ncbi:flavodoxin family protein [Tissierella pigra]|uniref:Flavodoxin family protein n=1 Tax=Tissierella pigra TaxID=2607614 RepID=A0A6N7Y0J2_9FIRM|nr:flavodoxin family protein [Tissierella pigra]MSU01550.1 flavodoxin family protein [Tissierella pigra]